MLKLIVKCDCGQQMQVPRSALGRRGLCPNCGRTLTITNDNARPMQPQQQAKPRKGFFGAKGAWWQSRNGPSVEAKRRFAEGVDLYMAKRYAEALAIFTSLAEEFPDDPDIAAGRKQCMEALRSVPKLAIAAGKPEAPAELDAKTVMKVLLEKMVHGTSDDIQLRAAELACRVLGLLGGKTDGAAPPAGVRGDPVASAGETAGTTPPVEVPSCEELEGSPSPAAGVDTADSEETEPADAPASPE